MKTRCIKALFLALFLALVCGFLPKAASADGNGTPSLFPFPQDGVAQVVYTGNCGGDITDANGNGIPLYIVALPAGATNFQVALNFVPDDVNDYWEAPIDTTSNNNLSCTIRPIGSSSSLLDVGLGSAKCTTLGSNDGYYVTDNVSQSDFNWDDSTNYYIIDFYDNDGDSIFLMAAYIPDATQATYTATAVSSDASRGTAQASFVVNTADGGSEWLLTATPAAGYGFQGWQANGQTVSTTTTCLVTLTASTTYTACFGASAAVFQAMAAVADSQAGWGTVSATETAGGAWTLAASPAAGYRFGYWESGGEIVSTAATCTVTPAADTMYTAYFGADNAPETVSGQTTQDGAAAPASADGAIAAVPYTANAAPWFTDVDGDALTYAMVSAGDGANDVSSDVYFSGSTLVYTPSLAEAGQTVTIVVKANDGTLDSVGDVTVTVSVLAPGSKCSYGFTLGSDTSGAGALFNWNYDEDNNGVPFCDSTAPGAGVSATIPYVGAYMNSGDDFVIYCSLYSFDSADYNFAGWTIDGVPGNSFSRPGVTVTSGVNGNGQHCLSLDMMGDSMIDLDIAASFVNPNACNYTANVSVAQADAGQGTVAAAFKGNTADGSSTWELTATPAAGYAFDHWAYRTAGSTGDYTTDTASCGQATYTVIIPESREYEAYFTGSQISLGTGCTLGRTHGNMTQAFEPGGPAGTMTANTGSYAIASSVFVGEQAAFQIPYTLSGGATAGTAVSFAVYAGTDTTAVPLTDAAGGLSAEAAAGSYNICFRIDSMPDVSQLTVVATFGGNAPVTETYAVSTVAPSAGDYVNVAISGTNCLEPTMMHVLDDTSSFGVLVQALEQEYPAGNPYGTWYIDSVGGFINNIGVDPTGALCGFVHKKAANGSDYWGWGSYLVNGFYSDIGCQGWICSDGEAISWSGASTQNTVAINFFGGSPQPCWALAVLRLHYTDAELLADGVTGSMSTAALQALFPACSDAMTWRLASSITSVLDPVKTDIDAIGTVTADSGPAIDAAKAAYSSLPQTPFGSAGYYPYLFQNFDPYKTSYNTLQADEGAYGILTGGGTIADPGQALTGVLNYIQATVTDPTVGSVGGEWAVLDLARGGAINIGSAWAQTYLANLDQVLASGGSISAATYYERVTLALSSLGIDASSYQGQDLTAPYSTYNNSLALNAKVFALIALDSKPYASPSVDDYINGIVAAKLPGGGWNLAGTGDPDPDMTAMAIQSLAPYYSTDTDVKAAVDAGLKALQGIQDPATGGFIGMSGELSTCSTAQVVTALCALEIDPTTAAWTTSGGGNPLTALLTYYNTVTGSFGEDGAAANEMATEQAAYALDAYERFTKGANPLYVMSDAFSVPVTGVSLSKSSDTITAGMAVSLTASIAPGNATNQALTWTSSNPSVATVVYNGTICSVTAVAPGNATIAATTLDGGFTATCSVTVTAGTLSTVSFQPAVNYPVGASPYCVAVGDFNGNGHPDLAVANRSGNRVSILLGNGDGSFQPAVNYPVGANPLSVAVGDFNGDGKLDLVVTTESDTAAILLGNGDGTFQAPTSFSINDFPYSVVAGDFNGNGKLDLAMMNQGAVAIWLGNGDGTFRYQTSYFLGGGSYCMLVAGDFNGDGKLDLAVANANQGNVSVLINNGDGTFQPAVSYPVGTYPAGIAAGDFNGDGKLDLAVANASSSDVSVLINGTAVPVTGVSLSKSTDTVNVGSTDTLTATIAPADATNTGLTWASSDSSVASVVYNGLTCTVTGVAAGSATIIVTTADGSFTATCDITVPAATGQTSSVTYDGNGATGTPPTDSSTYAAGAPVPLPASVSGLVYSGYTFEGWSLTPGGAAISGTTYTMGSADTTLYAVWTQISATTYTVIFDSESGSPATAQITGIASGATVTLPTTPTLTGNTFGGWYTETNGGGTAFTASTAVTGNITVYALWYSTGAGTESFPILSAKPSYFEHLN